jgi:hypothetical protein
MTLSYNAHMQVMRLLLLRQVLLTLSYSHVFSKPLSTEEVFIRLLFNNSFQRKVAVKDVVKILEELRATKNVVKHGEYWQVNHTGRDLSVIRKKRERLSALKMKELLPFIKFSKLIGWIRGVAVTGSVSVQNADAKDDVDLMIVVQAGRLWLVRPLLVVFSFLHGKRRSWNKEEYNSWCLNLWLEETSLAVIPGKQSVYTAYEVCQAFWVVNTNGTEKRFLESNTWVSRFLPNYFEDRMAELYPQMASNQHSLMESFLTGCNKLAYILQRIYMQRHMTTERVGLGFAFFHPRDTKRSIFDQWKKIIQRIS